MAGGIPARRRKKARISRAENLLLKLYPLTSDGVYLPLMGKNKRLFLRLRHYYARSDPRVA